MLRPCLAKFAARLAEAAAAAPGGRSGSPGGPGRVLLLDLQRACYDRCSVRRQFAEVRTLT